MNTQRKNILELIKFNGVTKLSENHFLVKSQQTKNLPYNVKPIAYNVKRILNRDIEIWTCQCLDFYYRLTRKQNKHCKHIGACIILKDTLLKQNKIEPTPQPKMCPRCQYDKISKNGFTIVKNDIRRQRYICKRCSRQFSASQNKFGNVHSDPQIISECLNLVMSGLSYRATARHIELAHSTKISHVTVLNWIEKFTHVLNGYLELFYPQLGTVWSVDEMNIPIKNTAEIKGKGFSSWLWSIIDPQTRFLIATNISKKQTTTNAKKILLMGKNNVTEIPEHIITDSLAAYEEAIRKEFHNRVAHIKSKAIRDGFTNLPIERYHNEIRAILKARRGLGNDKSAQTFAELLMIHHNFVKRHMGLDGRTPAQKAGIDLNLGDNPYLELIKRATKHSEKKKEYDIVPQLGKRVRLVKIVNETDCVRVVPKDWIEKHIWREINDILHLNRFVWLENGSDSCWIKEIKHDEQNC